MSNINPIWGYAGDFLKVNDEQLNQKFVDSIVSQISLMAQNMFVWENLPDTLEPYMIEQWLWGLGWCGFAYDEKYGYIALSSNEQNFLSINYRPTNATLIGNGAVFNRLVYWGGETERTLITDPNSPYNSSTACVIIRNNPQYTSTYSLIYPYLYTYYLTKRKEVVMLDQLQLQNLIMASPEDRAQIEGLKADIRKNKPIIALNIKGMKSEPKPLMLANNNFLLELQTYSKSLYGEIMERLGIKSLNYEKKAQMLNGEIDQNAEQTNATADILLKEREEACERINELFGLNVSVHINDEIKVEQNPDEMMGDTQGQTSDVAYEEGEE